MSTTATETTMDPPPPYQETVLQVDQITDEESECCRLSTQIQHDPNNPAATVPEPTAKTTEAPQQPTEEDPSAEQETPKRRKRDRLISSLKKYGKKCAKPFVRFGQTKVGRPFAITAIVESP
ncbi:hypothetical protein ASPVEDRAFT_83216 [Aspergillus versicolor CBS 583.65]|uniref:Uncharacterized protein n=1 Tax=Aspergillus versicolor CBS 583.65 TaxID=1036611 RepID=A0A1L9PJS2_ASPVE|nr:uncharacterized protein ASPVEDRAFT_83216 [Aspergillus versicolor CBS 583.65]OJJ01686.1 hypothetical protein ASPVEDRAFT_83216 [Aspergillus versicolor CBS 583.65]